MMKWIKGSVLVCAVVAVLGVGSQASAGKSEPPPPGFKDSGPAATGVLLFANGQTVTVDVSCKGTTIGLVVPFSYNLVSLSAEVIEGTQFRLEGVSVTPDMIRCYPDVANTGSLTMVVNTVTKFTAIPATGIRTAVIADVVLMRRTP